MIQEGVDAYGIELDPQLRDAGLKRLGSLSPIPSEDRLFLGDIRAFDLGQHYSLIIVPYNTLTLLSDEDVQASLACAIRHLHPDGSLFIEAQVWPNETVSDFPWQQTKGPNSIESESGPILFSEFASQEQADAPLEIQRVFLMHDGTRIEQAFEMKIRSLAAWERLLATVDLARSGPALDQRGQPADENSKVLYFEVKRRS
jgi:hypothetical protein